MKFKNEIYLVIVGDKRKIGTIKMINEWLKENFVDYENIRKTLTNKIKPEKKECICLRKDFSLNDYMERAKISTTVFHNVLSDVWDTFECF